jgi:hypothetical protein
MDLFICVVGKEFFLVWDRFSKARNSYAKPRSIKGGLQSGLCVLPGHCRTIRRKLPCKFLSTPHPLPKNLSGPDGLGLIFSSLLVVQQATRRPGLQHRRLSEYVNIFYRYRLLCDVTVIIKVCDWISANAREPCGTAAPGGAMDCVRRVAQPPPAVRWVEVSKMIRNERLWSAGWGGGALACVQFQ